MDLLKIYLKKKKLKVHLFSKGFAWLDTGNFESLHQASNYIQTIQERQGIKIACIEEIAFRMGYIDRSQLNTLAKDLCNSTYGEYLSKIVKDHS